MTDEALFLASAPGILALLTVWSMVSGAWARRGLKTDCETLRLMAPDDPQRERLVEHIARVTPIAYPRPHERLVARIRRVNGRDLLHEWKWSTGSVLYLGLGLYYVSATSHEWTGLALIGVALHFARLAIVRATDRREARVIAEITEAAWRCFPPAARTEIAARAHAST